MDTVERTVRSRMMAGIRAKHTRPEMVIRGLLHAAGFRYRLHRRDLPGVPDLLLPKYRVVIFVHGCFWHCHTGCRHFKLPTTNRDFWANKLSGNRARDQAHIAALHAAGWRVLVVWECATRDVAGWSALQMRIGNWLGGDADLCEIAG